MKKLLLACATLIAMHGSVCSQTFLNGNFEINTAVVDQINLTNVGFNALMSNTNGFGSQGNLDIITSATYTGGPQNGNWYIGMTGGGTDIVAMELSAPLVAGNSYSMSFWDKNHTGFISNPIEIGVSTNNNTFGTLVYTTTAIAINGIWTQRTFTFVAPVSGQFITVQQVGAIMNWVNVDNFAFTSCTPVISLGNDLILCPGQTAVLNPNYPNASYLWQNGDTTATLAVSQAGTYWVQVTDSCGTDSDTVTVVFETIPVVDFGPDTLMCNGATLLLDATNQNATYAWQNGSNAATFNVQQVGTYWVTVGTVCGTDTDTISVTYLAPPAISLGNDTTLCTGNMMQLNAAFPNSTYLWQDGSTGTGFQVTQPGTYYVDVTNACGTDRDTVIVNYLSTPSVTLGNDTMLCQGTTWVLNPGISGVTYQWQDGSANSTYTVTQPGTYWVSVSNTCGNDIDSVVVTGMQPPVVTFGPDTAFCTGNSITLDATQTGVTYLWQDGSTGPQFNVAQSGTYTVTVTNLCGNASDDIIVTVNSLPIVSLGPDSLICTGDTLVLDATWQSSSYVWQDGSTGAQFMVTMAGIYFVTLNENQCTAADTITIVTENCNVQIQMPIVFSPNGDGLNDYYVPLEYEGVKSATLSIFNRWGNLVKETSDLQAGWSGDDVPAGTYFWVVNYSDINDSTQRLKGSLTLIR